MTEEDIQRVADKAARAAVHDTLLALGIEANDPLAFQKRMAFLSSLEASSKTVIRHIMTVLAGALTLGVLYALWPNTFK